MRMSDEFTLKISGTPKPEGESVYLGNAAMAGEHPSSASAPVYLGKTPEGAEPVAEPSPAVLASAAEMPEEEAPVAEPAAAEAVYSAAETEGGAPEGAPDKKKKEKTPLSKMEKKILWKDRFNRYKAWLYLLPALVILAVFTVWPIINTLRIAFLENYSGLASIGGETFAVGFRNFENVVHFPSFLTCLGNTMLLTVITVPISTMLALLIAVGLNSIKFLRRIFQTIFFLPYVTNAIAIGMVFMAMFNMIMVSPTVPPHSYGLINTIIRAFGGKEINWVNAGSSYWANMAVLIIYIVWNALPFKILVLLGGLQSVNKQYYEAARVDGASRFRIFWRITVPLLSPMIAYVVITGFIGGFKEYTSIVGIFGETMGPAGADGRLNTMVGLIYDSLEDDFMGMASAASLILFLIIFAVTMVNLYVSKKKVHY